MNDYETRTISIVVLPLGKDLFSLGATRISIEDETAGEFVLIEQEENQIKIDPCEWPTIRAAINRMIKECRNE